MPAFLEVVSASRMRSILRRTFKKSGVIIDFQRIDAPEAFSGRFRASGEEGYEFTLNLGVDPQAPHAIRLLFISALTLSDYTQVEKKLVDLPGEVSFWGLRPRRREPEPRLHAQPRSKIGCRISVQALRSRGARARDQRGQARLGRQHSIARRVQVPAVRLPASLACRSPHHAAHTRGVDDFAERQHGDGSPLVHPGT